MYSNTTDVRYVYDVMLEDKFVHFRILNTSGALMKDQINPGLTPGQAVEQLKHFLKYNKGIFNVILRDKETAKGANGSNLRVFWVQNTGEAAEENKGMGIGSLGPVDVNVVNSLQERIQNLQEKMVAMNFDHNTAILQKDRELLALEAKVNAAQKEDSIMGIGSQILMGLISGQGAPGIHGIGDSPITDFETEAPPVREEREISSDNKRINAAIRRLLAVDKNLAANLEALAGLAESNRAMYEQGVQMIKNF